MKNIDSALVPKKKLNTGVEMPVIGLGTFSSYNYNDVQIAEAVRGAATFGYRHFD